MNARLAMCLSIGILSATIMQAGGGIYPIDEEPREGVVIELVYEWKTGDPQGGKGQTRIRFGQFCGEKICIGNGFGCPPLWEENARPEQITIRHHEEDSK